MPRKTIQVKEVLDFANTYLAHAKASGADLGAVSHFLEQILHRTGTYHGFRYLDAEYVREFRAILDEPASADSNRRYAELRRAAREDGREYRREYFAHPHIR